MIKEKFLRTKTIGTFTQSRDKNLLALSIFAISLLLSFGILTFIDMGFLTSLNTFIPFPFHKSHSSPVIVTPTPPSNGSNIPRLAYLISGSENDLNRLWRTLLAIYHPRNIYILHLDLGSSKTDREDLATRAANHFIIAKVGNVHVIKKTNMVTYRGPTMVANTLHACAILLKKSKEWDWFINLSASDYPLVTQDDLLFSLSKLPRNLNFIEHSSNLNWKRESWAKPIILDPGLFRATKSRVTYLSRKRELPDAFKLFLGSAWMVLSREFVEYIIWGWDNLPRTLLMYYANFISSPEAYFHTVICNAMEFNATVANHDLHYILWDTPPKQHPLSLTLNDTAKMIRSNAAFARKFNENDPVLDFIDNELLYRHADGVTPGGWCSASPRCSNATDEDWWLEPGPGSRRLKKLFKTLLHSYAFPKNPCE